MMPLLRLLRLPTVFTAMADVLMGFVMTCDALAFEGKFAVLLLASASLYLSGMVLNDIFDFERDSQARSTRPLPAGEISSRTAWLVAIGLLLLGNGCAATLGARSLALSLLLTLCIYLYDGPLKLTAAAPLLMGSCRFLNVLLAGSSAFTTSLFEGPLLAAAAGMGVYTVGLTLFARNEAGESRKRSLLFAAAVVLGGLGIHFALMLFTRGALGQPIGPAILLAAIAGSITRRNLQAANDPRPENVQAGVRTMLLSFVMIDAALILFRTGSIPLALGAVALLIPAMILKRWIPLT